MAAGHPAAAVDCCLRGVRRDAPAPLRSAAASAVASAARRLARACNRVALGAGGGDRGVRAAALARITRLGKRALPHPARRGRNGRAREPLRAESHGVDHPAQARDRAPHHHPAGVLGDRASGFAGVSAGLSRPDRHDPFRALDHRAGHARFHLSFQLWRQLAGISRRFHHAGALWPHRGVEQHRGLPAHLQPVSPGCHRCRPVQALCPPVDVADAVLVQRLSADRHRHGPRQRRDPARPCRRDERGRCRRLAQPLWFGHAASHADGDGRNPEPNVRRDGLPACLTHDAVAVARR